MSPTVLYICSILCSHFLSVASQETGPDPLEGLTFNDDSFGSIDHARYRYTPNNVPSPASDRLEIDFGVVPEGELGDVAHEECVIGDDGNNNNNNYGSNADNNNEGGNDSGNNDDNNGNGNNDNRNNGNDYNQGNDGDNNNDNREGDRNVPSEPSQLNRPTRSRSKKSKKSKKRAKNKRKIIDSPPVPVKQLVLTHADMVYHPINTPIYARTQYGILRGGEWERSIVPEDRIIDPVELSTMKQVSLEELKDWAGHESSDEEGERRMLVNQEKAATEYKQKNACVFVCAYDKCPYKTTDIRSLYKHVVGTKRNSSDRYLSMSCEFRIAQDGINKSKIGVKQRPKLFPWGAILCIDDDKITQVTDASGVIKQSFDVPASMRADWAKWMVDERSHKEKAPSTTIEACSESTSNRS